MSQTKTMNGQDSMSPIKPIKEVFSNENYLDESQDTEFRKTSINLIRKVKKFKEEGNKHFTELQEDNNKCLSDVPENTNTQMMQ